MADYSNIPLGLKVTTQIPLDVKSYVANENALKDLGSNNNLAFTYYKGAVFYCVQEGTRYQWREVIGSEVGLMPTNYTYPANVVAFGITYSNKIYNFFPILITGQLNSDWNSESGVTKILNKPTIPSITGLATISYVDSQDALKVDKVSGSRLITSSESVILGNTSGTNSGDNAVNNLYSGLQLAKQDKITLTNNNTSGAATLIGNVLNIPQYSNTQNLQQVLSVGNSVIVGASTNKAIDITLSNNSTLYQNGITVTVPVQTGEYPEYNPAPDAFVAYLNGQNPGTLTGQPVGFLSNMSGADNYGFIADLQSDSVDSVGSDMRSFDDHTGDFYRATKFIAGVPSYLFKVNNDGNVLANSFIKKDGLNTEYLMADGSVSTYLGLTFTPVNKAGDTMLGNLILNQDPLVSLGAATKQYVDNISAGIYFHSPVKVATITNLSANYTNGTSGVGAKLIATSNGTIQVDGQFPAYLERILVQNQSNAIQNGIYDVTVVGNSSTPFELTRSADSDNNPSGEIQYGDYVLVLSGSVNGGKGFVCNTSETVVVGTTQITYVQYNVAQAVVPGNGLQSGSSNIIEINPLITQEKINLTTIGSGAATLVGNTLNIPDSTSYWVKDGSVIRNNNIGNIEFFSPSNYIAPNGDSYFRNISGAVVYASGGFQLPNNGKLSCNIDGTSYIQGFRGSHWLSDIRFKYLTDLSEDYDERSLVDKGYVDSLVINSSTNYWTKTGNDINNNTPGTVLVRGGAGGLYDYAFKSQFLQGIDWTDGFKVQNGGNFYYAYGYGSYSSANTFGNASGSVAMTTSTGLFQSNSKIKYATDLSSTYDDRTLVDKAYVDSKKPYKVYTALLKRSGTTVDTPIVLENTIGPITFDYVGVGVYSMSSSALFTENKTVVFIQKQQDGPFGNTLGASRTSVNDISIIQSDALGTNNTNWIYPVSIEIRVYN